MGYCVLVAYGFHSILRHTSSKFAWGARCSVIAMGAVMAALVCKTITRNMVWSSRESLFKSVGDNHAHVNYSLFVAIGQE